MMFRKFLMTTMAFAVCCCLMVGLRQAVVADDQSPGDQAETVDPTAWGSDHVGQSAPEYITGDECLFCHRQIGPAWPANRHQLTIRPVASDSPRIESLRTLANGNSIVDQTRFVMGHSRVTRFVKRSGEYGKLELLSAKYLLGVDRGPENSDQGKLQGIDDPQWDAHTFADRCAGCHATAVDHKTRAFSAMSLDCFVCHGNVDLAHTKDPHVVFLSKTNQEARQIVSICGQCHLRGGKSKSSGLPYPNTFVAGDNLFRDFDVDLSNTAIDSLTPSEQHIFENARDIVVLNRTATTCISCHSVHGQSTEKHQQLDESMACRTCHLSNSNGRKLRDIFLQSRRSMAHNRVCDY